MTKKKSEAILNLIGAIYECIQEAGSDGIPSGHLYSVLMGHMELGLYNQIIGILVDAGKIRNDNHLLKVI